MFVQIIVFSLIILLGLLFSEQESNKNRKKYVISCCLILLLKAALRSVSIGRDTSHYSLYFYESMTTPWSRLFRDFVERYQHISGGEDVGYYVVQKCFSTFISDFNVYTFFIQGILFYIPFGVLVYKNSKNILQVMFAFTLMNALFMGLPMANARQVYAIGMCIWAFIYLGKKKYLQTALFITLAFFIHASALLFILPVAFSFISIKALKPLSVIAFFLSFVVLSMPNTFILFMASAIESDRYMEYGESGVRGGGITYIVLSLMLCAFCIYGFLKKKNIPETMKNWYMMIPLTVFFVPLIYSSGSMMRITMYFQIFFILIVPYTIDILAKPKDRNMWYYIMIAILVILSVSVAEEYRFFWEENQNPLMNWT